MPSTIALPSGQPMVHAHFDEVATAFDNLFKSAGPSTQLDVSAPRREIIELAHQELDRMITEEAPNIAEGLPIDHPATPTPGVEPGE